MRAHPLFARLFVAVALFAAVLPLNAQTTVTTDPVGFHTVTINPGFQTLGLPLLRPAIGASGIQSNTAMVITASGAANFGAAIQSGTSISTSAFYLEITSGTATDYVGDRFDIDVAATMASANNTVTINGTSANNTVSGSLPNLSGYNFVIRPHVTIGYVFGTKGNTPMQGASSIGSADQIQFYNTALGGFETYFLLQNSNLSVQQWFKVGGVVSCDTLPIPPGTGMFVKRVGSTPVTLTIVGDVRTTPFSAQPMKGGFSLIAEGYPVDRSPNSRGFTTANGFTGTASISTADQIQQWNGSSFNTYYLIKGGSIEQWINLGQPGTNFATSNLFSFDKAVFVKCAKTYADYASTKPY